LRPGSWSADFAVDFPSATGNQTPLLASGSSDGPGTGGAGSPAALLTNLPRSARLVPSLEARSSLWEALSGRYESHYMAGRKTLPASRPHLAIPSRD
jgi:hypothetical protein